LKPGKSFVKSTGNKIVPLLPYCGDLTFEDQVVTLAMDREVEEYLQDPEVPLVNEDMEPYWAQKAVMATLLLVVGFTP